MTHYKPLLSKPLFECYHLAFCEDGIYTYTDDGTPKVSPYEWGYDSILGLYYVIANRKIALHDKFQEEYKRYLARLVLS